MLSYVQVFQKALFMAINRAEIVLIADDRMLLIIVTR